MRRGALSTMNCTNTDMTKVLSLLKPGQAKSCSKGSPTRRAGGGGDQRASGRCEQQSDQVNNIH